MPRAFSISAADIAAESKRTGGDHDKFDFANLADGERLHPIIPGPGDVHLKILAVSAEHNVDHAILADTINIAEARGGKIYPGNSALGEVLAVGANVTSVKPGERRSPRPIMSSYASRTPRTLIKGFCPCVNSEE